MSLPAQNKLDEPAEDPVLRLFAEAEKRNQWRMPEDESADRKTWFTKSIEHAKQSIAETWPAYKPVPDDGKPVPNKTNGIDDVKPICHFIHILGLGLETAIDTDADPFKIVGMRWGTFQESFPEEVAGVETMIRSIPDRNIKLPTDKNIADQLTACFLVARDRLNRSLLEVRHDKGNAGPETSASQGR